MREFENFFKVSIFVSSLVANVVPTSSITTISRAIAGSSVCSCLGCRPDQSRIFDAFPASIAENVLYSSSQFIEGKLQSI